HHSRDPSPHPSPARHRRGSAVAGRPCCASEPFLFCAAFALPSAVSSPVDLGLIITGGWGVINSPEGADGVPETCDRPRDLGNEGHGGWGVAGGVWGRTHPTLRERRVGNTV